MILMPIYGAKKPAMKVLKERGAVGFGVLNRGFLVSGRNSTLPF